MNTEEAIQIAIDKTAFDMEAHASRIVPVDTGRLRASIKAIVKGNVIHFIADTEYAEYVEWGTSRQRPQPYMRPTLQLAIEKFFPKRLVEELKKVDE